LSKFEAGFPSGIESMLAGKIGYGENYKNIEPDFKRLEEKHKQALMLLVACDRIFGFFESRGGVKNGPLLIELAYGLVDKLAIERVPSKKADFSSQEANVYYGVLAQRGIVELANDLGAKDVFCTLWETINKQISIK
jgi:hypothetical protein